MVKPSYYLDARRSRLQRQCQSSAAGIQNVRGVSSVTFPMDVIDSRLIASLWCSPSRCANSLASPPKPEIPRPAPILTLPPYTRNPWIAFSATFATRTTTSLEARKGAANYQDLPPKRPRGTPASLPCVLDLRIDRSPSQLISRSRASLSEHDLEGWAVQGGGNGVSVL